MTSSVSVDALALVVPGGWPSPPYGGEPDAGALHRARSPRILGDHGSQSGPTSHRSARRDILNPGCD
jgi:hypothetical protein